VTSSIVSSTAGKVVESSAKSIALWAGVSKGKADVIGDVANVIASITAGSLWNGFNSLSKAEKLSEGVEKKLAKWMERPDIAQFCLTDGKKAIVKALATKAAEREEGQAAVKAAELAAKQNLFHKINEYIEGSIAKAGFRMRCTTCGEIAEETVEEAAAPEKIVEALAHGPINELAKKAFEMGVKERTEHYVGGGEPGEGGENKSEGKGPTSEGHPAGAHGE
jgi:hypothetical protein